MSTPTPPTPPTPPTTPTPSPPTSSLNAARRARELAELADGAVVDLLVVGLGATGAGVALDAAARGLSVAAIDAHDLAFGTSRWSSKLIHGGLRYLASGQVGIAYQSAAERGVLMTRTAPHLVRALPFVLPETPLVTPGQAALTLAGLRAGDLLRCCQDHAASPRWRRCASPPRCTRTGCAVDCSRGTGRSPTTPGWSSRWRAPPPRTGRAC
jgi:hypothetical protein